MQHVLDYRIGDIRIEINSDVSLPTVQNDIFQKFQVPPTYPDARFYFKKIDINSAPINALSKKEKKSLSCTVFFPERWYVNPMLQSPLIRDALKKCLIKPDLTHISLSWNRIILRNFSNNQFYYFYFEQNKQDFAKPIFNARFRNFLGLSFVNFSSLLMHGAGVEICKKAALFLAPDEGGKTTLIEKFNREHILSDDQVILQLANENFFVHSTPFGKLANIPKKCKLGAIFLVKKSKKFRLIPARPIDAIRFIWNESNFNILVLPKKIKITIFDLVNQACHAAPIFYLHTPKNHIDIKAIRNTIAN